MNSHPELDRLVILLSSAIAQRRLYFAKHPKVKGLGREFVDLLVRFLDATEQEELFLGVVDGKLVYEGRFLVGPSIAGGQLIRFVGMLHGGADGQEQIEPFANTQAVLVAVLGDGQAFDVLHHEVGPSVRGQSRIVHAGDMRMLHQRQRLLLGLEAGQYLLGVHARLGDLQCDAPFNRAPLLGQVDCPVSAFTQKTDEPVGPNLGSRSQACLAIVCRRGGVFLVEATRFLTICRFHRDSP